MLFFFRSRIFSGLGVLHTMYVNLQIFYKFVVTST